MKITWIASLVLISAVGVMAQAPSTQAPTQTAPAAAPAHARMTLTSNGFEDGGIIPNKFTMAADGAPVSPELMWTNVPDGVVTFTLIVHDPDTSVNKTTTQILHWMVFNIPGTARELPEGEPAAAQLPDGSIQALNYGKHVGYMGMGAGAAGPYHHYTFELFALDTKLSLGPDATQADVMTAMDGHVLMKGVLVGRFHRP
jgi:Raf kinase inhibitor-like YbhB/YbcL family protein